MIEHLHNSDLEMLGSPDTTIESRRAALTRLLAERVFQKLAASPQVESAMSAWTVLIRNADTDSSDSLLAVSELVRMGASAPAISPKVKALLCELLTTELPPVEIAMEADVRLNVARAVRMVMPPWAAQYAARAIASEDKGEKARGEFCGILVESVEDIDAAIGMLAIAFDSARFPTDDPNKVLARRGAKALEELRKAVTSRALIPGDGFGSRLDAFTKVIVSSGHIADDDLAKEVSLQVLSLMQVAVRARFSTATMSDTFLAAHRVRRLFPSGRWPDDLLPALSPLASDIKEAIVILGKQGVTSQELLRQLETVVGSRDAAREETAKLAESVADIAEEVKYFLVHWRPKRELPSSGRGLEEAAMQHLDSVLGEALRRNQLTRIDESKIAYVCESVGSFDPDSLNVIQALIARAEAFQGAIEELAKRRRIAVHGVVGEILDASPKYFTSSSGAARGVVKAPAVVRIRPDGTPGVCILKGHIG